MNLPLELWDLHFLLTWFYLESIKEKVQCSLYDLRFVYSLLPDLRRHWRFSVYCVAGLLLWRRKAAAEGRVPVSVFLKHTSDYEYLSWFEVLNEKDWNFTRIWICSCFKSFFKVFLRQKKEKVLIWLVLGEALYLIPTLLLLEGRKLKVLMSNDIICCIITDMSSSTLPFDLRLSNTMWIEIKMKSGLLLAFQHFGSIFH